MVVGADASANHPVIAIRFRRAVARGARLIVVNPKRVELCDQADLWIRQNPGTDVALFNAVAQVILDEGLAARRFVRARTENLEGWVRALEPYTLDHAERVTGVPRADIVQAARWYARPAFTGSCLIWGMGITQHVNGTSNAHAVLNLSLVAGQMGFAGSGISPLRGQNNVQGAGDAGSLPPNLPGYGGAPPPAGAPPARPPGAPRGGSPPPPAPAPPPPPRNSSTRCPASGRAWPACPTRGSRAAASSGRARPPTIRARGTSTPTRSRAARGGSSRSRSGSRPPRCRTPSPPSGSTPAGSSTNRTAPPRPARR